MNVTQLGFNDEDMLAGLKPWVLCESPSYDPAAVNRMQDIAAHDLAVMGASIERISPHSSIGDCIRARFAHPQSDQPRTFDYWPYGYCSPAWHTETIAV